MAAESTIANQIRTALAQHLKRDVSKIKPGDRLREDLGLDSLAMIELLFKIEEHFDLEIPNEDLSRVTSVADVTAYVEEKLGGRPAGAPAPVKSAAAKTVATRAAVVSRAPTKVRSIKAAATHRATKAVAKAAPVKKKGSRRA